MSAIIHSVEAERSFIGCVVTSGGALLDRVNVTPDLFHLFQHRVVVEAVLRLFAKNAPINDITITQEIPADDLKKIGGPAFLAEVCFYPSPTQAAYFLKILEDKRTLRGVQEVIRWADMEAQTTEDVAVFCAELQARTSFVETGTKTENVRDVTIDHVSERLDSIERGEKIQGIEVPLEAWNKLFGGLVKGQLYALAGRPGTGKTSLMEQIVAELISHNRPVLVFEKDMSPEMLIERMSCRLTGVPYWKYVRNRLDPKDIKSLRSALKCLKQAPLHLYSPAGLTAERLCAIVRREKRVNGVQAVFIDHMQVLSVGKDIREGLTKASIAIRNCATETGVPHVALAQLNRDATKGRPTPENIKEFDQLYADCDCMAILWSETKAEDLGPNEKLPVNIFAAKNRNGPVAEEPILFDGAMMKFDYESPET